MKAHSLVVRGAFLAAGLVVVAAAGVPTLRAQDVRPDPRWSAWLGCWELKDASKPEEQRAMVCVIPGDESSAVEMVSIVGGRVANREMVVAAGAPREASREGCTGWERATWAPGGERLYLRAEYSCGGGLGRRSSGMMAMTPDGDWLDVQGVTVRDRTGIRVLHYRPAAPGVLLADEIAAAVQPPSGAVRTARLAAGAPINTGDVIEASREVDAQVVQAWLTERGQGFELDARGLEGLADAGVPGSVTDVMVALSYPRVFRVDPATLEPESPAGGLAERQLPLAGGYYGGTGYYSPYGWGCLHDPYGYFDRYGFCPTYGWNSAYGPYSWGPYSPLNYYNPWAYGSWGGGISRWWYTGGTGSVVIVDRNAAPTGGRVVKGRGYQRPRDGQTGTTQARPRNQDSGTSGSVSSGGGSRSGSDGSSSGARPASSSGGSSSSGSGGRTAHPRPPR